MAKKAEFLSNKPLGEDLFDGQSQDKVAIALMQHILKVDAKPTPKDDEEKEKALPRIIGIEGSWGSGKSNTLLQLKNKLGKDYYFFTYDAWGNQEDLQRRSLLQLLTNKLIKDEKLIGDTQVKMYSSALDVSPKPQECTWQERVDLLTSRKSSTHNVTIPSIYDSTKYFLLMLVLTGLLVPLLNSIKVSSTPFLSYQRKNVILQPKCRVRFTQGQAPVLRYFALSGRRPSEEWNVYGLVLGKNLLLCREKFVILQQKHNQKE